MKSENCVLNRVRVSTPGPHLPTQASVEYPLLRIPDRSTFRMNKSFHPVEGHNLSDESQVFCLSDNLLLMISPSRYYINSVKNCEDCFKFPFNPQFKYNIRLSFMCQHIYTHHLRVYRQPTESEQIPVGLMAQLVVHCTGIAEISVRIPFRPFSLLHK